MIIVDQSRLQAVADVLSQVGVPAEPESDTHSFEWNGGASMLANAYMAIVGICHQTSPIGERRLEGCVNGVKKTGWDYLKERYLLIAGSEPQWVDPSYWAVLRPVDLARMYEDAQFGLTLNRVAERTFLLNDLGSKLGTMGYADVKAIYSGCQGRLAGGTGLLGVLSTFEAYRDPVYKKSMFLISLLINECKWTFEDSSSLRSPVDYHELRGHLRIGTVRVDDRDLTAKLRLGLPLTVDEDTNLRAVVQDANEALAEKVGTTASRIHYLLWNLLRNCCSRASVETHCIVCPDQCGLPPTYVHLRHRTGGCPFSSVCASAGLAEKIAEPAYVGHYY